MKYTNLYTGFEIETIINTEKHNFNIGAYHNGIKLNKYFKLERDSSINAGSCREFEFKTDCEFITPILKTKTEFFKAVKNFIKVLSKNNLYKLNEVMNINSNCGCHIHLSLSNNKKFKNFIDYEILKETRDLFFNKLDNNNIINENTKTQVKNNYTRSYAETLKKRVWKSNFNTSRLTEFNSCSERDNKGLEWRSFNLCGVKNWLELEELFKIAYEVIYFLFTKRTKGYILKRESLRIPKTDLKDYFNKTILKETEIFDLSKNKEEHIFNINSEGVVY